TMKHLGINSHNKILLMFKHNFCKVCFLLVSLTVLQSCSTTRIITKYDCNTVANNTVNKKTTWTFAWGLVQPRDIDPKCESSL
ncbi:MAG: hypothetical protein ABR503_12610, partial [Chitinophagaceae bacterium]